MPQGLSYPCYPCHPWFFCAGTNLENFMQPVPSNWFQDFFSGIVVEMWVGAVPEEMTRREVEFIRNTIAVDPPAKLLDVPCGAGRHTLLLAAEGYRVTGADISAEFLDLARARAAENHLEIAWRQS